MKNKRLESYTLNGSYMHFFENVQSIFKNLIHVLYILVLGFSQFLIYNNFHTSLIFSFHMQPF